MKILLINGPPRSGKDLLARMLEATLMEDTTMPICHFERFSMPLKRAFAGMMGIGVDSFGVVKGDWEDIKDEPHELLNNRSYRQWQIDFSEVLMKPLYGEDVFGRLFCARIAQYESDWDQKYFMEPIIVVPDSGFQIELKSLNKYLPEADWKLIRLHRNGTDFSGDSRSYLQDLGDSKLDHAIDVDNNGTRQQLLEAGLTIIKEWK